MILSICHNFFSDVSYIHIYPKPLKKRKKKINGEGGIFNYQYFKGEIVTVEIKKKYVLFINKQS